MFFILLNCCFILVVLALTLNLGAKLDKVCSWYVTVPVGMGPGSITLEFCQEVLCANVYVSFCSSHVVFVGGVG